MAISSSRTSTTGAGAAGGAAAPRPPTPSPPGTFLNAHAMFLKRLGERPAGATPSSPSIPFYRALISIKSLAPEEGADLIVSGLTQVMGMLSEIEHGLVAEFLAAL